jgi:thiol-disulfide isomerase/thioredoxin
MNLRRASTAGAVALVAALALTGCAGASGKTPAAAPDRLPEVTLQPLDSGKAVDLSTLRGPMVINLWASWCTPCRKELPKYQEFSEKHAGKVEVLGIDFQETRPAAARELARETGVDYRLVSDPDGALRAVGLPKVMLLDEQGRIAHEEYVEITSVAQLERLVRTHLEAD